MSQITKIRNLVGDQVKTSVEKIVSAGNVAFHKLTHEKIKTGSVVLSPNSAFNVDHDHGVIYFTTILPEGEYDVIYQYSGFRDEEIEEFLAESNNVYSVAVLIIDILLADAARRFDYSTGTESFKTSQIFDHLYKLRETLSKGSNDIQSRFGGGALVSRPETIDKTKWQD